MLINEDMINYLEELSCISLSGEERLRMQKDLGNIIAGMELLSALDTSNVSQEAFSNVPITPLRKDELKISFPREDIIKNAPDAKNFSFKVPQTIE